MSVEPEKTHTNKHRENMLTPPDDRWSTKIQSTATDIHSLPLQTGLSHKIEGTKYLWETEESQNIQLFKVNK